MIVAQGSCVAVVVLKTMVEFPRGRRLYINRDMKKALIPLIQSMCCG